MNEFIQTWRHRLNQITIGLGWCVLALTPVLNADAQIVKPKPVTAAENKNIYLAQGMRFHAIFPEKISFFSEREFTDQKITYKKTNFVVTSPYARNKNELGIYNITIDIDTPIQPVLTLTGKEDEIAHGWFERWKSLYGKNYEVTQINKLAGPEDNAWFVKEMRGTNKVADFSTILRVYVSKHSTVVLHVYYTPTERITGIIDHFMSNFEWLAVGQADN
jgi:hypothetical protein